MIEIIYFGGNDGQEIVGSIIIFCCELKLLNKALLSRVKKNDWDYIFLLRLTKHVVKRCHVVLCVYRNLKNVFVKYKIRQILQT